MIYAIGDSFTFGDELPDVIVTPENLKPSDIAWPALLSKKWNKPVTNLGRQASGNTRIIKRSMDCVFKGDAELIIVAWTNPSRIEWCDEQGPHDIWPGRDVRWMPASRVPMVEKLSREHNDEVDHWCYRTWLRDIILLQTFFKLHNQRYVMVQSHLSQLFNAYWPYRDLDLRDQIDTTYFVGWPLEGMTEWMGDCPRGPKNHPLELGHQRIADKIDEYIRNFSWVS